MESLSLKDSIRRIQEEIISVVEALFAKKIDEGGVTMNFLRTQLHEFFVGSFSKAHFENVSSFSNTMQRTREMVAKWESFLSKSEEEIDLMEFWIECAKYLRRRIRSRHCQICCICHK